MTSTDELRKMFPEKVVIDGVPTMKSDNTCSHREQDDAVNHPSHYTSGKYEVIDIIEDGMSEEAFVGFCMGNVIKYVMRHGMKNGVEDLKKARWYLNRLISLESERE